MYVKINEENNGNVCVIQINEQKFLTKVLHK